MKVQKTVKEESGRVARGSILMMLLMLAVFFLLHRCFPEKIPFDYRLPLSAALGTAVSVLNFFMMGMTVQSIVNTEKEEDAYQKMRLSYRNRNLMQLLWIILALVAPPFQPVAAILPLLFPGTLIRLRGIFSGRKRTEETEGGEK